MVLENENIKVKKSVPLSRAVFITVVLVAIAVGSTLFISQRYFNGVISDVAKREKIYSKLSEIDSLLANKFYGEMDQQGMIDGLIKGYVAGIGDPYSRYLTTTEYEQKQQDNAGEKIGVGISIKTLPSGYAEIMEVYKGAAGEAAGLKVGDIIQKIDDKDLAEEKITSVPGVLLGKAGTNVSITFLRDSKEQTVVATRKKFEIPSITHRLIDDVGYIKISEFNGNTSKQFSEAVDQLIRDNAKGLVFDLRNNGGGVLSACYKMVDKLVPKGDIAYGINNKGEKKVLATSDESFVDLPMVVLVNGHTASSSELFVAALLDFGKATAVGTKTFGKGILQELIPLKDRSAVNVTAAGFLPPSGVSFHGKGIEPTVKVELTAKQEAEYSKLDENTDPQLKEAIRIINDK